VALRAIYPRKRAQDERAQDERAQDGHGSSAAQCIAYFAARHPDLPPLEIARHLETDICNISLAEPDRHRDIEHLTAAVILLVSIAQCYPGRPVGEAARIAGFTPLGPARAAGTP